MTLSNLWKFQWWDEVGAGTMLCGSFGSLEQRWMWVESANDSPEPLFLPVTYFSLS